MVVFFIHAGAANTHLRCLDDLQSCIERSCSFVFHPLSHRRNAAIMGLVCSLLAGGSWELTDLLPTLLWQSDSSSVSSSLLLGPC